VKKSKSKLGWRLHYESIAELIADNAGVGEQRVDNYITPPSEAWDLNLGFVGALKLARDGWRLEGTSKPSGMLANPHGRIEFAETGDEVDVGAFLAGEPECFIARVGEVPFRSERLVIEVSYSHLNRAADIAKLGEQIWQAILDCHSKGIEMEITVLMQRTDRKRHDAIAIPVRQAGEPLESHQFVASLHPAFVRRLGFNSLQCHCTPVMSNAGWDSNEIAVVRQTLGSDYSGSRYCVLVNFKAGTKLEELPTL
jgi:hypothetical protein